MSLNFNGLSPDQTAVAVDILTHLRLQDVGEHYLAVPFARQKGVSILEEGARIRKRAKEKGISLDVHWIANHKVDKRHHRRVKFTTEGRLWLPIIAVFVFPTQRDQVRFQMWFGVVQGTVN
jgi:hypothetical protein